MPSLSRGSNVKIRWLAAVAEPDRILSAERPERGETAPNGVWLSYPNPALTNDRESAKLCSVLIPYFIPDAFDGGKFSRNLEPATSSFDTWVGREAAGLGKRYDLRRGCGGQQRLDLTLVSDPVWVRDSDKSRSRLLEREARLTSCLSTPGQVLDLSSPSLGASRRIRSERRRRESTESFAALQSGPLHGRIERLRTGYPSTEGARACVHNG